jgi:acyl-CoA dehydrogenase
MDDLFSDALRQLLADRCTPRVVREIEAGGSPRELWRLIEESGFPDALVGEAQGGAGLGLPDAYSVFELCGEFALPVPLAETMLARGLLAAAGVERPAGSVTFAIATRSAEGRMVCDTVRSGAVADWALVTLGGECRLLPVAAADKSPAGFCLDATLAWGSATWDAALPVPGVIDVRTCQACVCSALMAGALMSIFTRTLQYANDRVQFGRPIGKFQAIQHQLSLIAEHAFAARMAAQLGARSDSPVPDRLRVAIAKARTSEAALEVAALSHSIHGAIGFTAEYDLQLYTRRLHMWRQAAGSESYWHDVVGAALVEGDGTTLDLLRVATDVR